MKSFGTKKQKKFKTFKTKGQLFAVSTDGKLSVFVPNFDSPFGLNGISGFWETISDIGSSVASGTAKVFDTVSNAAKSILTPEAINAATGIAAGIIGYKTLNAQAKLTAIQQQAGGQPQDGVPPGLPGSGQQMPGAGWNIRPDTQTVLMLGGAALLVVLLLKKGK